MLNIKNKTLLSCLIAQSNTSLSITNPATETVIGHIATQSRAEIDSIIAAADKAQQQWKKTTAKERAVILLRWHDLMMENQDDLARLMTLEQGKPLAESKGEVAYGASFLVWFAEEAKRAYGETIPTPVAGRRLATIKQPIGIATAITPWNFPIAMITRKAAPALAAGCAFIGKPANQTPLSAFAVAELAYQAGVPKALLQLVVNESSSLVGEAFCDHDRIKKLSFTGSTRVGRILMAQCAKTIKRTSMELGGNAPFIVFEDADLDLAVAGAMVSKYRNAGQTCVCANRFYIHDSVYDQFVAKLTAEVAKLRLGNGLEDGVTVGPVIDENAKNNINRLIQGAVDQGATVAFGGQVLDGAYVDPTILTDVRHDMDIIQEEIFGPVAPIVRFSSDEELIAMANDTIYGLASYFYSQNINRIWYIAEALEYGMVGINEGLISTEVAPFGGVKQSGIGKEGAKEGLDEYLDQKYLCFGGLKH